MVASRVSRAPAPDAPNLKSIDLSEQGLLNAWELGKRRLAEKREREPTMMGDAFREKSSVQFINQSPGPKSNMNCYFQSTEYCQAVRNSDSAATLFRTMSMYGVNVEGCKSTSKQSKG